MVSRFQAVARSYLMLSGRMAVAAMLTLAMGIVWLASTLYEFWTTRILPSAKRLGRWTAAQIEWLSTPYPAEARLAARARPHAALLRAYGMERWVVWSPGLEAWGSARRRDLGALTRQLHSWLGIVAERGRRELGVWTTWVRGASARTVERTRGGIEQLLPTLSVLAGRAQRTVGSVAGILPDAMVRAGVLLVAGGVAGLGLLIYSFVDGFDPAPVLAEADQGVVIVDRKGKELFAFAGPNGGFRKSVKLSEVSPWVIDATIAAEDDDFWTNPGINVRGLGRAVYENLAFWEFGGFGKGSGGSSITQQLARNLYFSEDVRYQRTGWRKVGEMLLALSINRRYSKEQVLEGYLNQVFYGNHAYGIEAAAQRYFNKPASKLTLSEAALLAGLPQAPSDYDPLLPAAQVSAEPATGTVNPAAKERQELVLDLMVAEGYVSQTDADAAKAEAVTLAPGRFEVHAPHFVMHVLEQLEQRFDPQTIRSGLRVVTTLDSELQAKGEAAVRDQLAATGATLGATNGSLLALDPRTGEILAMVGSVDYFDGGIDGQVNMTTARRQPGSTFKIFTYTKAFELGLAPSTIVRDAPTTFIDEFGKPYQPTNFDGKYHGLVPIRTAFANSMNLPAVQTIAHTGVPGVVEKARMLGITTLDRDWYGYSLTLGAAEVQLLDLTYAYSVYANGGTMAGARRAAANPGERPLDPIAIQWVEDFKGRRLLEYHKTTKPTLSPEVAYLITDVLSDNKARELVFGGAMRLPDRPAAVKTGTTEDHRDFWTVGYTPELAVGVWMGNSNNTPLTGGFSGSTTAPIWTRFMSEALAATPPTGFAPPPGIIAQPVCTTTGLAPVRGCRSVTNGLFVAGLNPVVITPESQQPQYVAPQPVPRFAAPQPSKKKRD